MGEVKWFPWCPPCSLIFHVSLVRLRCTSDADFTLIHSCSLFSHHTHRLSCQILPHLRLSHSVHLVVPPPSSSPAACFLAALRLCSLLFSCLPVQNIDTVLVPCRTDFLVWAPVLCLCWQFSWLNFQVHTCLFYCIISHCILNVSVLLPFRYDPLPLNISKRSCWPWGLVFSIIILSFTLGSIPHSVKMAWPQPFFLH